MKFWWTGADDHSLKQEDRRSSGTKAEADNSGENHRAGLSALGYGDPSCGVIKRLSFQGTNSSFQRKTIDITRVSEISAMADLGLNPWKRATSLEATSRLPGM